FAFFVAAGLAASPGVADDVAAGVEGAAGWAGGAGADVCACAARANTLTSRAMRSLLIGFASFEVGGVDTIPSVAAVNARLCIGVDTTRGGPFRIYICNYLIFKSYIQHPL